MRSHWADSAIGLHNLTPGRELYVRISGYSDDAFKNGEGDYVLFMDDKEHASCPSTPAAADRDCNQNGYPDECDIRESQSEDCNNNSVPDGCENLVDCDGNGKADECEAGMQVVFADRGLGGFSHYGVNGSLKTDVFSELFDVLGESYGSEIPEPQETADEDFSGPNFSCAACTGGSASAPFGVFLRQPKFLAGSAEAGGVYGGAGSYHLYSAATGGAEFRGRLQTLKADECGMPLQPGASGFRAELSGISGRVGEFEGCLSLPLGNFGTPGFSGRSFPVSGSYDLDGVFVGKGSVTGANAGEGSWDIYLAGRFIEPGRCKDCNRNAIGDEIDIAAGTSADENQDGVPDECQNIEVDCFGVRGGSAKPDRCGVCGGDGGSYLQCFSFDAAQTGREAAAAIKRQARHARRLAAGAEKAGRACGVKKAAAAKLREAAVGAVMSWPKQVKGCLNQEFCTTVMLGTDLDSYQNAALRLYRISKKAAGCGYDARSRRGAMSKARRFLQESLQAALAAPLAESLCCDELTP